VPRFPNGAFAEIELKLEVPAESSRQALARSEKA
jgi:hypothetical protein